MTMLNIERQVRYDLPKLTTEWHDKGLEHFEWETISETIPQHKKLCTKLHWSNYQVWHAEDYCRSGIDAHIIKYKPCIDKHNQIRNDTIENIDEVIEEQQTDTGEYNSETVGSIIDRTSVLALKAYHWQELINQGMIKFLPKLEIAHQQFSFLCDRLDALLSEIRNGKKRIRTFRQLKMYNNPETNLLHKERKMGMQCEYCKANAEQPALQHARGCKLLIEFFGGSIKWDTTKEHQIGSLTYIWDDYLGTWVIKDEP